MTKEEILNNMEREFDENLRFIGSHTDKIGMLSDSKADEDERISRESHIQELLSYNEYLEEKMGVLSC